MEKNHWALVLILSLSGASSALATPELRESLSSATAASPQYGEIHEYQMGDVWGKKPVFESSLPEKSKVYQRAAMATGYIRVGGTGFYLGQYAGEHVVATNHHVCPTAKDCEGVGIEFRLLHRVYKIKKLLQTLPDVDLSLVTIAVPANESDALKRVGRMFSVRQHVYRGEPLIMIGFGVAGNPHNYLSGVDDSDCKVYSGNAEYKHLGDPDKFNPMTYRTWSFAHGCDMSHGDSGSAMIDRRNGAIVGINWTGRIPKLKKYQKSSTLQGLLQQPTPEIWTQLNYAASSVKIGEALYRESNNPSLPGKTKQIYLRMLDAGRSYGFQN